MWSCVFFSLTGRTSSRSICGSIQERSLTCVRNVVLPLPTTTTWRTTCAYTPACAPISAQAALRLSCARITCTATLRRMAATASPLVEDESLECESQGYSTPPWACWALAPTQAPGLVTSGDGGAQRHPQRQRWMGLLEPMHTVLSCRSWQGRRGPETAGATRTLLDTIVTLHRLWDRPVNREEKKHAKANFEKKNKTTNYSSINQIRVSQNSNLYISFSFYFRKWSRLASTWVGLSVKEQRTLQITHPRCPLSGPFLSL